VAPPPGEATVPATGASHDDEYRRNSPVRRVTPVSVAVLLTLVEEWIGALPADWRPGPVEASLLRQAADLIAGLVGG
jgi:hypothetical protein